MQHQESTIEVVPQIMHQRIQSRAQAKVILQLQVALALYSTFTMPFFIILTSIPSIKVVFFKSNRLTKRVKKKGERMKKEAHGIKDAAKISVPKKRRHRSLAFTALNEHPWISKRFVLKI
jgi:hypothetical protein